MATDEAMMSGEQQQLGDVRAADLAVANLASISTTYSTEVQGEPFAQLHLVVDSIRAAEP